MGTLRAVAAAGLYVAFIAVVHPTHRVFAFDPDEGINAIKALLVHGGAALYRDVAWLHVAGHALREGLVTVVETAAVERKTERLHDVDHELPLARDADLAVHRQRWPVRLQLDRVADQAGQPPRTGRTADRPPIAGPPPDRTR